MLQHEEKVSMATLRAAPTRHRHTEQFSGILTNQLLNKPLPRHVKREGRMGKTKAQTGKQTASYCDNTL